ncbi:MAG: DinB family protein [Chloroflexi bacterium]|nr:DinB family protein [Chloroflexota bacterium]
MADPEYPKSMPVDEFILTMRRGRAEFAALWADLSDEQITRRPGPQDDWSVKDLMGHILWWEGYAMTRVMLMQAGGVVPALDDFNALNAQVFAAHRDLPLDFLRREWEASLHRLEAYLRTLSDKQLNHAPEGWDDRSPYRLLGGNTFGHYLEHQPDLEQYVVGLA